MPHLKALPLDVASDPSHWPQDRPLLTTFPTPLVTLDDSAVRHNIETMRDWTREHGVGLAPHGKTTMSRELWQRQIDEGAWGITVATPWQMWQALDWGMPRVMLANALVQEGALRAVAQRATTQEIYVWADSVRAVEIMQSVLERHRPAAELNVLIELGGTGGRTGARTVAEATAIARAVRDAAHLRVAGVAGYEGALAHSESEADLGVARAYLEDVATLHRALRDGGYYGPGAPIVVTAGGSIYFDVVAEVLAPLAREEGPAVDVLVRSGAYVTHDDGIYRRVTPMNRDGDRTFRAGIHGWATVVSRPEPGLVLVDGGRRDFPFDEGLPEPQAHRPFGSDVWTPLEDAAATAVNDQHMFLSVPDDSPVQVGDVIRFGLSHPCTTFDKWQALPVIDDVRAEHPRVIGLVETQFG